jgi:hypothetical protein
MFDLQKINIIEQSARQNNKGQKFKILNKIVHDIWWTKSYFDISNNLYREQKLLYDLVKTKISNF